jgi:hypothetical protein
MAASQLLGLSFAMGAALFTITVLLGWFSIQYSWSANFLKWAVLPALGYTVALGINSATQYISCKSLKLEQIAITSSTIPIAIYLFLLLTLISFIRKPIEMAIPMSYKAQYGGLLAVAFYMFWAGMFGEGLAGGFSQNCSSS